ncbi:hypothetical protein BVX98_02130 [bacterium F11]|nr:hypothetical protein BVX98_02130 [bacterium F11]
MDILLVHGYNVTSTRTYGVLPKRLKSLGHTVKDVYLSKYVTLDDDLTLPDIVHAFQAALNDVYGSQFGKRKFACITHSTGGLVVREWVNHYYGKKKSALPMSHLIMLAPPNHGSRLAKLGKSRLSRLRSLWGTEPGLRVLDGLELGSQFQWDLNSNWLTNKLASVRGFYSFVITGQWIDKNFWDTIAPGTSERGSDGVVRVSAANLNMQIWRIHHTGQAKKKKLPHNPFLITPKTSHSGDTYGIMGAIPSRGNHPVLDAIGTALKVKTKKQYNRVSKEFREKTTALQKDDLYQDKSKLDRYVQIVFRICDQMGNTLNDYALELTDGWGKGDQFPSGFLGHHHKNIVNPEFFVIYVNYDVLSKVEGGELGFRVQSAPDTPLVAYEDFFFKTKLTNLIKPNQATLIEVVLKRRLNKNIFRLTKNLGYQKIRVKASPQWVN